MNKLNKNSSEWINGKCCYYDENYYIAEGYCDRKAAVIYKGHYSCRKCVAKRIKALRENRKKIVFALLVFLPSFIAFFSSPWLGILSLTFSFLISWSIARDIHGEYLYEGEMDSERDSNFFCCKHCPKIFIHENKKQFITHLKEEHFEEYEEITEAIQQIPANRKIIRIEFRKLLNEHKQEL